MKYKIIIIVAGVAILSSLYSCRDSENKLTGVWSSVGYGKQMIINDSVVNLYDTYSGGCAFFGKIPMKVFGNISEILNLTQDSLKIKVGLTEYEFTRTGPGIPACNTQHIKNNPLSNFDALWNTFNENYSSFDLRDIDWNKMKEHYRPMLTSQSSDYELYSILDQMISELKDGHVFLDVPDSLKREQDKESDNNSIGDLRNKIISQINSMYLNEAHSYNKGNVIWGTIKGNIGYIQINNFEDLANYNISDSLPGEEFWDDYWKEAESSRSYTKDVLDSFNKLMGTIINDLKSTEFCIIDVRFNNGGFDQAGLEVLSFLTENRILAYTKKARYSKGYTRKQAVWVDPGPISYKKPVYILTSYQTASASETFVLGSMNLANVHRIGSNTAGVFSDVLDKRLPNGWKYGLSNEIYESPDSINYEVVGIRPNYNIDYKKDGHLFYLQLINDIKTGDIALEKAMELGKDQ